MNKPAPECCSVLHLNWSPLRMKTPSCLFRWIVFTKNCAYLFDFINVWGSKNRILNDVWIVRCAYPSNLKYTGAVFILLVKAVSTVIRKNLSITALHIYLDHLRKWNRKHCYFSLCRNILSQSYQLFRESLKFKLWKHLILD